MPEPYDPADPLRAALRDVAVRGSRRVAPAPAATIRRRGDRLRRRRWAALAVAAGLTLGGTAALVADLLPGDSSNPPAVSPSPIRPVPGPIPTVDSPDSTQTIEPRSTG
ncbi:hypothetical protein [Embleya sp. AB8]|uniref:hypothetical protein n=1 Tax=Embleya sp. AB8 TaxID=3156304 RepID=UPI003C715AAE